ncbi:MAG TPA: 4a-hydroxytetrahydrobiopterin dehydratase [Verrucomicrobia bacterium]|nr:MAG: 4a-hydroxytetrahydrobiopterin dehydratase [Lentisphaerae bacterium GWF2_57_35]HBA85436.1 4a-hydroxytetrahydrobiopterin dehydratase [Verrucomicrobiota bacterium]
MNKLTELKCKACQSGEAPMSQTEIADLKSELPDWKIVDIGGVARLEREYKFDDFAQALAFTNKIGYLAEAEQHHPAILTEWGRVKVSWWTHKVKGLHRNDFIMAAKTDDAVKMEPADMHAYR